MGKKGRSVNSQAERRKHTDECGGERNSEQPGLRAHVPAGTEPKCWFGLQRAREHKDGGSGSGTPMLKGPSVTAGWHSPGNYGLFVFAFEAIAEKLPEHITKTHNQVVKIKRHPTK